MDDRATVTRRDGGEQQSLFADTDDDQQTLTGERATSQCLFESDDGEQDDREDEPADTITETNPRAVATDGGQTLTGCDEEHACEACRSANNGLSGFVHDVADESWTDHDALCRDCFVEIASGRDTEAEA